MGFTRAYTFAARPTGQFFWVSRSRLVSCRIAPGPITSRSPSVSKSSTVRQRQLVISKVQGGTDEGEVFTRNQQPPAHDLTGAPTLSSLYQSTSYGCVSRAAPIPRCDRSAGRGSDGIRPHDRHTSMSVRLITCQYVQTPGI